MEKLVLCCLFGGGRQAGRPGGREIYTYSLRKVCWPCAASRMDPCLKPWTSCDKARKRRSAAVGHTHSLIHAGTPPRSPTPARAAPTSPGQALAGAGGPLGDRQRHLLGGGQGELELGGAGGRDGLEAGRAGGGRVRRRHLATPPQRHRLALRQRQTVQRAGSTDHKDLWIHCSQAVGRCRPACNESTPASIKMLAAAHRHACGARHACCGVGGCAGDADGGRGTAAVHAVPVSRLGLAGRRSCSRAGGAGLADGG